MYMGPREIDGVVALRRETWENEVALRMLLAPLTDRPEWWRRAAGELLFKLGEELEKVGSHMEYGPRRYA